MASAISLCAVALCEEDAKRARAKSTLEILSLESGDCTLRLSWPWGEIAANHVMFDNQYGPAMAIVEPSPAGVRVTFEGWGKDRFAVSADRVRIIDWVGNRKEIDFAAEMLSGRATVRG
jgi:hypothetical protein